MKHVMNLERSQCLRIKSDTNCVWCVVASMRRDEGKKKNRTSNDSLNRILTKSLWVDSYCFQMVSDPTQNNRITFSCCHNVAFTQPLDPPRLLLVKNEKKKKIPSMEAFARLLLVCACVTDGRLHPLRPTERLSH